MKYYIRLLLPLLLSTGVLISCKKDNTLKDPKASLAGKTWSGTMTYTGQNAENYSVHFNNDNSLLWSQFSGEYSGKWQLTGNHLTMTFDVSGVEVKGNISDDNKLSDFVVKNTSSYKINTCALVENPNPSLDYTIWEGSLRIGPLSAEKYVMTFRPGSQVILEIGYDPPVVLTYQRIISTGAIKVNTGFAKLFAVVSADNEMRGCMGADRPKYPWVATKK